MRRAAIRDQTEKGNRYAITVLKDRRATLPACRAMARRAGLHRS